ncbi:hypothetical protein C2845_PM05G23760 [Panicum miliaceum]|uniref:Uncharacterized protein n=1 Tax=Panicum miliaceum TaxID=4540 RepID=A0A3L6T2D4_PANMI|nr:hypothetical protein C2845_PM05G23760 [Panicum miliaceum]
MAARRRRDRVARRRPSGETPALSKDASLRSAAAGFATSAATEQPTGTYDRERCDMQQIDIDSCM